MERQRLAASWNYNAKSFGLILAGAIVVTLLVTLGMGLSPTNPRVGAATDLSYWVQSDATDVAVTNAIKAGGYVPKQVTDRGAADLFITKTASVGATAILTASIGAPVDLEGGQIIKSSIKPTYFATVKSNGANTAAAQDVVKRLAAPAPEIPTWSMTVVGDIGLGRSVFTGMKARGDFLYPYRAFLTDLSSADLTIANLECALSDKQAVITDSGMTFVAPLEAAKGLKDSGIDVVSIANNHSFNGGMSGYMDTLAELRRLGLVAVGGGVNAAEAHAPRVMTVKGQRVAILAYSSITGSRPAGPVSPGMAYISMAPWGNLNESEVVRMEADIKAARWQADIVLVYHHWGSEYTHNANPDQRTVAHRAVDAGADMVLGAHPHWVQGVEWYNDRLIAYSLGNFIFDQDWSAKTRQGTMLKATFRGNKLNSAELVPYEIAGNLQPRPATTTSRQILGDVYRHSWWPTVQ